MEKMKNTLYTAFGETVLDKLDREDDWIPLSEYPRPQMVRDSYLCLNGWWNYAIISDGSEIVWDRILVPFSPEAALSTVGRQVFPKDRLLYRRTFFLPEHFNRGRVLLHFDAVDYKCRITLNGQTAGEHKGGYFAFCIDITAFLAEVNELALEVTDPTDTTYIARGKQRLHRGNIWYTPQSGIWQTVWLESVPENYIESFRITPDIDKRQVFLEIESTLSIGSAVIKDGAATIAQGLITDKKAILNFPDFELWSPENPRLYDVEIRVGNDLVKSFTGMRKFSLGKDEDGFTRLFLNNRPYFHNGVLDQGYYPDGLLTPPSDDAMIYDITAMKDLGFNMLRKHIKIEPLRWYYHCDRLGMIVWQDMVNGGRNRFMFMNVLSYLKVPVKDSLHFFFGRQENAGREEYMTDADRTIKHLYNVTSLGMWVPFNESWGQFDADRVGDWVKEKDSSRTIDRYSGWHDQGHSDFTSLHVYFRSFKVPKSWERRRKRNREKCLILTEFGGYSYKEPGHHFINRKDFGYRKFAGKSELSRGYRDLYEKEIIPAMKKGLSAAVYTQLTDVEDEVNGILTYDRKVLKIDSVRDINKMLEYM